MCVCVRACVCPHMCATVSSLQYFSTQWQPIQIQLKQHRGLHSIIHSSVTHPLLLSFPGLLVEGLGGEWVGALHPLLISSLCLSLFYFLSWSDSSGYICFTWHDPRMFIWLDNVCALLFVDFCSSYMLWCNTLFWALYLYWPYSSQLTSF